MLHQKGGASLTCGFCSSPMGAAAALGYCTGKWLLLRPVGAAEASGCCKGMWVLQRHVDAAEASLYCSNILCTSATYGTMGPGWGKHSKIVTFSLKVWTQITSCHVYLASFVL